MVTGGCGDQTALEMRRQQLAYTPEKLAAEPARRLAKVHGSSADPRRRRDVSRSVAIEDQDRGVDRRISGDRPDPLSREVFVEDATRKIQSMSEDEPPWDTLREAIALLRSRKDVNSEDVDWLEKAVAERWKIADD